MAANVNPFLGELRLMSFVFPPAGWALCNGQLLSIAQNQALFSLFGTTYGGDGRVNFGLPDLRGRVPIHFGAGFILGQRGGEQAHTVTISEMPAHFHPLSGTSANADTPVPNDDLLGTANNLYAAANNLVALNPASITSVGGSQPHENMQPYLTLSYCVALQGIFPSQS